MQADCAGQLILLRQSSGTRPTWTWPDRYCGSRPKLLPRFDWNTGSLYRSFCLRAFHHRTSQNSTAQLATSTTLLPRQVFFIYISTFLPAHPSIIYRYLNLILPLLLSVLASSYHKQQVRVTLFISTLRPAVNHRLPPLALVVLRGFEPRFCPLSWCVFPSVHTKTNAHPRSLFRLAVQQSRITRKLFATSCFG